MNRNEQIKELFNSPTIQKIINRATTDQYYQSELRSILFEALCKLSDEKLDHEYKNGIEKYCAVIIKLQFKSKTSQFHNAIRKPRLTVDFISEGNQEKVNEVKQEAENDFYSEEKQLIAEKEFQKLNWYEQQIFQYVIDGLTIKEISEKTKINRQYIGEVVSRIRNQLKSNIKKKL